jgi:hypothetical protein
MWYTVGELVVNADASPRGTKFLPVGVVFEKDENGVLKSLRTWVVGSKDSSSDAVDAALNGAVAIAREMQRDQTLEPVPYEIADHPIETT